MTGEQEALRHIARVLEEDLSFMLEEPRLRVEIAAPGGTSRYVSDQERRIAEALGDEGRVVRTVLRGWGNALCPEDIVTSFAIDLGEDLDMVVHAARRAMADSIGRQMQLNSDAVREGFTTLPTRDEFSDPARFTIEEAVWNALVGIVGRDRAPSWLRTALNEVHDRNTGGDRRRTPPVSIFRMSVRPLLRIRPLDLDAERRPLLPLRWTGTRVTLPEPWLGTRPQVGDLVHDHLPDLPDDLAGRRIVRVVWPDDPMQKALPVGLAPAFDYEPLELRLRDIPLMRGA